jgi:hypothetical protein
VCIKGRGRSAQSGLVIDNYFMNEFHQLLFGGTRGPVDQPGERGWWVHGGDVKKYVGETAYLSLEDTGPGWFEVEQVRLADRPPPKQADPTLLRLLQEPYSDSEDLLSKLALVIAQAFAELSVDRAAQAASVTTGKDETANVESSTVAQDVDIVRQVLRLAESLDVAAPGLVQLRKTAAQLREFDGSASPGRRR